MAKRYELTDEQYALIEELLPLGRDWTEDRQILNGMFWKLGSGAAWRDIPERYGHWRTVYDRFRRWSDSGLFARFLRRLRQKLRGDGDLDLSTWYVDSTNAQATKSRGGREKALGYSKGGFGTKSFSFATPGKFRSPRS
jgi:transposase